MGGLDRSAGSPDVVEEKVGGGGVDFDFGVEGVGGSGLGEAGFVAGADLDGVLGAGEELIDTIAFVGARLIAQMGEMFGDEIGVVEAASADVLVDGGERNDDDEVGFGVVAGFLGGGEVGGEDLVEDGGERAGEGTDRIVLEVMNEFAEETVSRAGDESWWESRAVGTKTRLDRKLEMVGAAP